VEKIGKKLSKPLEAKVSVCITVLNEESSISKLIESLLDQSKKPNEIIIVDGGSIDKTTEIIRHLQKKDRAIRLLAQRCSRSEGRNLSIELAKNSIIAITDADCVADKYWLEKITTPFIHNEVDMVAGFYEMIVKSPFDKALSFYLGVTPKKFDSTFLPSARSMAIRKEFWTNVGGFPQSRANGAEDTEFNYNALISGARIARVKDAIVYWKIPDNSKSAYRKIYDYAKWDAQRHIFWHPKQKLYTHNIRSIFKIFRYSVFLLLIILSVKHYVSLVFLAILLTLYSLWAYRKVYEEFGNTLAGIWGIYFQFLSDFAVMKGFISGLFSKKPYLKS